MSSRPPTHGLFGTPALRGGGRAGRPAVHDDAVRVVSVERFRLGGSRLDGADVAIEARGVRLRLLVRAGLVVYPSLRGEPAVTITAPALRAEVEAAALDAAGGPGR